MSGGGPSKPSSGLKPPSGKKGKEPKKAPVYDDRIFERFDE